MLWYSLLRYISYLPWKLYLNSHSKQFSTSIIEFLLQKVLNFKFKIIISSIKMLFVFYFVYGIILFDDLLRNWIQNFDKCRFNSTDHKEFEAHTSNAYFIFMIWKLNESHLEKRSEKCFYWPKHILEYPKLNGY